MAYLVGKDDSGVAFKIDLPASGEAIIGRSAERANVVVQDGSVSGSHCSIVQVDGAWILKDLGSTNGTQVNGEVVSEVKIFRGDTLSLGTCEVVIDGEEIPERTGAPTEPVEPVKPAALVEPPAPAQPLAPAQPAAPAPAETTNDVRVEYIQPTSMKIEPLSARSPTVKVLPTQFRKKSAHTGKWVALIAVFSVLAIVLIVFFVMTLLKDS